MEMEASRTVGALPAGTEFSTTVGAFAARAEAS
jgi:hypothetical protein